MPYPFGDLLYPKFKQKLIGASSLSTGTPIDLLTNTINIALIDVGIYTYSATDEFFSSASTAIVGGGSGIYTFTTKTVTNGVFDAEDAVFTAISGSSVEALIIYKSTGVSSTSPLIAYIDVATSGLPVTPNGGNITVQFDPSGIFSL